MALYDPPVGIADITPATAVLAGECRYCGRDFGTDEDEGQPDGPCPVTDDCPSYFEAIGIPHPEHPGEPLFGSYAPPRTLDWRDDARARIILASIEASPPRLARHRHIYVLTSDDWSTYEGYRVECLNAIQAECLRLADEIGTDAALDAYYAAGSVQDHVAAVISGRRDALDRPLPTDWLRGCAQARQARQIADRMAA